MKSRNVLPIDNQISMKGMGQTPIKGRVWQPSTGSDYGNSTLNPTLPALQKGVKEN